MCQSNTVATVPITFGLPKRLQSSYRAETATNVLHWGIYTWTWHMIDMDQKDRIGRMLEYPPGGNSTTLGPRPQVRTFRGMNPRNGTISGRNFTSEATGPELVCHEVESIPLGMNSLVECA